MRVIKHGPGKIRLYGLVINPGENLFEDELWAKHYGKLPDQLKKVWFGGSTPMMTIANDAGEQLKMQLTGDAEIEQTSAKEKIDIIMAATEPDHLEAMAQGETRKTVLSAIQKRAKQLAEAM